MADRDLKPYGGTIKPDTTVKGRFDHLFYDTPVDQTDYDPQQDNVVLTAMNWIADQSPKQAAKAKLNKDRSP